MEEVKEKALAKMLEEMNKEHSPAEDVIHNWLCDQEDAVLFEGILDEKKSINGAFQYCVEQAKNHKSGNCAMVQDDVVFGWVRKYFTGKKTVKTKKDTSVKVVVSKSIKSTAAPNPEKVEKLLNEQRKKGVIEGQLDLFGELL